LFEKCSIMSKKKKKQKKREKEGKWKKRSKRDSNKVQSAVQKTHPMEILASLLWKFPDLPEELMGMLSMLEAREPVDLSCLDNTDIRDNLSSLLEALGLEKQGEFAFQWKRSSSLLRLIAALMDACGLRLPDSPPPIPLTKEVVGLPITLKKEIKESSKALSSNEEDSENEEEAGPPKPAVIGPMRPSAHQLSCAQEMMESVPPNRNSDSESSGYSSSSSEDSDAGPMVAEKATRIGMVDKEKEDTIRKKQREQEEDDWARIQGKKPKRRKTSKKLEREEWMMTPGEAKGIGSIMPTARNFKSKGPRSETPAEKPMSKAAAEDREKMEKVMAKHREIRGKSLMEHHQDKSTGSAKGKKESGIHPASKIGYDRESLMESRSRMMTQDQAAQLVEKARMLDSKFSRSVERSFL